MVVITSCPPPTDDIMHQQSSTKLCINSKEMGVGTLYIAERRLAWVEDTSLQQGYSIEYKNISLHAISRDPQSFPEECLYVLLDIAMESPQEENGDRDEEEVDMTELRFIPEDKSCLDTMFQAMSQCQALHPDTDNSFSSDEGDQDDENCEDEEEYYFAEGPNRINGLIRDSEMDVDGQFDDAEEVED